MKLTKLKKYNIINNNNKTKFKNRNMKGGAERVPTGREPTGRVLPETPTPQGLGPKTLRPIKLSPLPRTESVSGLPAVTTISIKKPEPAIAPVPPTTTALKLSVPTTAPTTATAPATTKKLLRSNSKQTYTENGFAVSKFQNNYISKLNGADTLADRINILTKIDTNSFNIPNLRYMFDKYIKLNNSVEVSTFNFKDIAQTGIKINDMISTELYNTVRIYSRKMPLYEIKNENLLKLVQGNPKLKLAYDTFLETHHLQKDFDTLKTKESDTFLTIYMPQLLIEKQAGGSSGELQGLHHIIDITNKQANTRKFRMPENKGWQTVTNANNIGNGNQYYGITSGLDAFQNAKQYKISSNEVRNFVETCNDLQILYITKHIELYELFNTMHNLITLNIDINDKIDLLLDPSDNVNIFTGNIIIKLKSLQKSENFIKDALTVQQEGLKFSKDLKSKETKTNKTSQDASSSKPTIPSNQSTIVEPSVQSSTGYNSSDLVRVNLTLENEAQPIIIKIDECSFYLNLDTVTYDTSFAAILAEMQTNIKKPHTFYIIIPEPIYNLEKKDTFKLINFVSDTNNNINIAAEFEPNTETVIKCTIDEDKIKTLMLAHSFSLTINNLKKLQIKNLPKITSIPVDQVMYIKYNDVKPKNKQLSNTEHSAVVTVTAKSDNDVVTLSHNVIIGNNKHLSNSSAVADFIRGFNANENASTRSIEFLSYIIDDKNQYDTFQLIKNIQVENTKSLNTILKPSSTASTLPDTPSPDTPTLEARISVYKEHTDLLQQNIISKTTKANGTNNTKRPGFNFENKTQTTPRYTITDEAAFKGSTQENLQVSVYKCYDLQILYLIKHLEFTEMTKIIFYYYDMLIKKIGLLLFVLSLYTIQVSKTPEKQKEKTILAIIDNMNDFLSKQHKTVGKINITPPLSGGANPQAPTSLRGGASLDALIATTQKNRNSVINSGFLNAVSTLAVGNTKFVTEYENIAKTAISITNETELNLPRDIVTTLQLKYGLNNLNKDKISKIATLNDQLNLDRTNYYTATIKCSKEGICDSKLPDLKKNFIQKSIELYKTSFLPDIPETKTNTLLKFIDYDSINTNPKTEAEDQIIDICNKVAKIVKQESDNNNIPELLFMNVITQDATGTKSENVIELLGKYNIILNAILALITTKLKT